LESHPDPDAAIVVESIAEWSTLYRQTLAECAVEVLPTDNGAQAVELAHGVAARLVLLHMPGSNLRAFDTCGRIREVPGYSAIPIVLIGSPYSSGERAAAAQVGATALLALPFSTTELRQTIFPLLGFPAPGLGIATEWKPRREPPPAFGEPKELARGSRLLGLYRRGNQSLVSRRTNWLR
jgi:CheY-like chemotaxis protein